MMTAKNAVAGFGKFTFDAGADEGASEAENHFPAPPAVEGHTIRWLNA